LLLYAIFFDFFAASAAFVLGVTYNIRQAFLAEHIHRTASGTNFLSHTFSKRIAEFPFPQSPAVRNMSEDTSLSLPLFL
jgi:hypothetical protein